MKIEPINTYRISGVGVNNNVNADNVSFGHIGDRILKLIPFVTVKEGADSVGKWNKWSTLLSKPMENRLLIGVTALLTQPAIDYYNHRVDDETRVVSRNRTIAKIIAGTLVGCAVRGLAHKFVVKMTNTHARGKIANFLLPASRTWLKKIMSNETAMKNYRSAISTMIALLVMSVTNILIDAPLTAYLTNRFNERSELLKKKQKEGDNEIKQSNGLKEGVYA